MHHLPCFVYIGMYHHVQCPTSSFLQFAVWFTVRPSHSTRVCARLEIQFYWVWSSSFNTANPKVGCCVVLLTTQVDWTLGSVRVHFLYHDFSVSGIVPMKGTANRVPFAAWKCANCVWKRSMVLSHLLLLKVPNAQRQILRFVCPSSWRQCKQGGTEWWKPPDCAPLRDWKWFEEIRVCHKHIAREPLWLHVGVQWGKQIDETLGTVRV